jgi:hypothetical protein
VHKKKKKQNRKHWNTFQAHVPINSEFDEGEKYREKQKMRLMHKKEE